MQYFKPTLHLHEVICPTQLHIGDGGAVKRQGHMGDKNKNSQNHHG